VSARKNRHRGKHVNRTNRPPTNQTNDPPNDGNTVASDLAAKQEPVRLGEVVPPSRLTENAPRESQNGRALQQFGLTNPRALGASQSTRARSASDVALPSAESSITCKVLVVLFSISVPIGLLAFVRMKELPLFAFGDWRESTAASTSLSLQDPMLEGGPGLRLGIPEVRGMSGEPLPIGTSLEGLDRDAVVIVRGLIPGMTLSTGSALGANAWRVPASEFVETWVGPPEDFSGAVDITAELHLPDQTIADRRRLRLAWAAPTVLAWADPTIPFEAAAPAQTAHQRAPRLVDRSAGRTGQAPEATSAPLKAGETSVPVASDPTSPNVARVPNQPEPALVVASEHPSTSAPPAAAPPGSVAKTPQLDGEQIAILIERGKHLVASGDLAAARVVLRRAADSKHAEAALVLGSSYDPLILRELKTLGFAPDLELARRWYEKAKELGSEEAQQRIQILAKSGW
jgi:hypothetical protein